MLIVELLRYLQALQLDTVWLDQHSSIAEHQRTQKTVVKSKPPKQPDHITFATILAQEKTTSHQNNLQKNEDHELEIRTRLQLLSAKKDNKLILLAFLSPTLQKNHLPTAHPHYGQLVRDLLAQLKLTEIRSLSVEEYVQPSALLWTKALLFSQSFNSSQLVNDLNRNKTPTLVLDHPLSLLRSPHYKKQLWQQSWLFLNS